ncbi:hypothetical protein CVV67_20595, partial [Arthrobacter stackebrandtii]
MSGLLARFDHGYRGSKKRPAYCSSSSQLLPGAPCNELTQRIPPQRSPAVCPQRPAADFHGPVQLYLFHR